jgi:hypothetical protein
MSVCVSVCVCVCVPEKQSNSEGEDTIDHPVECAVLGAVGINTIQSREFEHTR